MMRLVLAALLALSAPGTADAAVPAAWQTRAIKLVERVWKPACPTINLVFADPAKAPSGPDLRDTVAGWATPGTCEINLNRDKDWLGYPHFCDVVLHEGGHLVGREHSDRGIMQPVGFPSRGVVQIGRKREVVWEGVDRRCLRPMDR